MDLSETKYLYHTRDFVYTLGFSTEKSTMTLSAYSDATWADDEENRRSRSGGAIFIGDSLVHCYSRVQNTVAKSSVESEYQALSAATSEVCYFRNLLTELGYPQINPTIMHVDNQGAKELVTTTKHHNRTKHIDVHHHVIRECVEDKKISMKFVPTDDQIADMFTKPLGTAKFQKFRNLIGISSRGGVRALSSMDKDLGSIPDESVSG